MQGSLHTPVMCKEVIEYLNLRPGLTIIDATVGLGGHARAILDQISPGGRLIGIDKDNESLELTKEQLKEYSPRLDLVYGDFRHIDKVVAELKLERLDAILFDLGVSSFQFDSGDRGFSIKEEGPLDMRMDRNAYISAYDLVNNLTQEEISNILSSFGQERWHNRIARAMVREREKNPISTTRQLSEIIIRSVPYAKGHWHIHPATRTFQALRIAVNRELESLEEALKKSIDLVSKGGRIVVISFHSLEDRIVKNSFRLFANLGKAKIITLKPLVPTQQEIEENPRSRSSKLRVIERI
jgi:16S rRNA (cytosine1402-N4)-methyltransferase